MTVPLHHQEYGSGKAVFILHGLFGSSRNWTSAAKRLGEHGRVIVVDLRNHGQSPHAKVMDYPAMAEDVFTLADELELESFSLAGHSMGGKVAMQMALQKPDRIDSFVSLDIAPVNYQHRYGKLFAAMHNLPVADLKNRQQAETLFCPEIGDTGLCRFLLQNLVKSGKGYEWRINLASLEKNIDIIKAFPEQGEEVQYPGPCLFLGGGLSDFIQKSHKPTIMQYFPHAKIRWLDQAGHMLHVEEPEQVFNAIREMVFK